MYSATEITVMGRDRETINAKVSPEMRRRVRVEAAKLDMSMSEFIREALEERLEESDEPAAIEN